MIGDIVVWLVLGLVAGALAKLIMPGRDPGGPFVTIAIGIAGSFIGGYVGNAMNLSSARVGGLSLASIGTAVLGALILLFVVRLIKKG